MEIDLYTFASFILGVLAGCLGGIWLSGLISSHKVERLEQRVNVLSDNKFKATGERVTLKQLEQRLDAEAASIPMTEDQLREKSGEIRELTAALNETTALTSELAEALRIRKAKVKQLQTEQSKWVQRNKALLIKSKQAESKVTELNNEIAAQSKVNARLESGEEYLSDSAASLNTQAFNGQPISGQSVESANASASPALAAGPHHSAEAGDATVDRLKSRLQEMESELQNWADRVDQLEAKTTTTSTGSQASSLAMLEAALRGEAEKQDSIGSTDKPQLLGGGSAS